MATVNAVGRKEKAFMRTAEKEAFRGMRKGDGGPFGAVIVKNGKVIAKAHNMVIGTNDPTAHAEITAIRKATKKLKCFNLSDCEIYSSCEPCPMCLSAIHWANIGVVHYNSTRKDAAAIGFDDEHIYIMLEKHRCGDISLKRTTIPSQAFEEWKTKKDKVQY